MKRYIVIIIVQFLTKNMFGQCLLLCFVGNDCTKCQVNLSGFFRQSNQLPPVFFVFPEDYRTDSAELVRFFSDIKGSMIFSNQYFNLVNPQSSSIAYLNSDGEVSLKKSLLHLSPTDGKIIDSLYNLDAKLKIQRPDFPKFADGWKMTENSVTKTIIVDSGGRKYKYKPDSITIDGCIRAINKLNPGFYTKTIEARKEKSVPDQFLKPGIKGFTLSRGVFYYIMGIPYVAPPNEHDMMVGNKGGHIASFTVMVRVRNGIESEYLPVLSELNIPGNTQNMVFPARSFKVLNDSSVLFFQYSTEPGRHPADSKYLSIFKILNDRVVFKKRLDNQFPKIYFEKGLEYALSPSFNAFDYPYYSPVLGTQIADIHTGKDFLYNPPYPVDYSRIDSIAFVYRLIEGKDKLPINNAFLFNRKNKTMCLVSKVDSVYYINIFNTEGASPELISTVNLSRKIHNIADYAFFDYDKSSDIISIEDKAGVVRSIPVGFLIGTISDKTGR